MLSQHSCTSSQQYPAHKSLKRSIPLKGTLIGLAAGLAATIFDSLYILVPEAYVPYEYPFLIIILNTCFWAITGCVSGLLLYLYASKKQTLQKSEHYYWILFFLLPFALLYGVLGRFNDKYILHPGFDHNLVFLWVAVFFVSVIVIKKKSLRPEPGTGLLIAEVFTILALFNFCSNVSLLSAVSEILNYFCAVDFFKDYVRWTLLYNRFCMVLYITGTMLILGFYYFISSKFSVLNRKPVTALMLLFFTASVLLTVFYRVEHKDFQAQYQAALRIANQPARNKISRVILIVLDTVRKRSIDEHWEAFDNLRAFARDSLVFENCIASSSWTLPSHASLFTGLYPREHGAHDMLDSSPWFDGFPPARPLSDKFTTLAEVFKKNGYFTASIVANFAQLQPGYKLNQGFQIYDYYKSIGWTYAALPHKPLLHGIGFATDFKNKYSLPYRKAEDINDAAYALLERCASSPFFLFLNYMDAHDPYRPSRPFKGRFLHSPFSLYKKARSFFQVESAEALCAQGKPLYEGALAYLDYHLGKFFERLKQMGMYDDSLIIVTSDHGELFCEHGLSTHRVPLYEGVLRIPLYIKLPHHQVTGRKLQSITLADLYPTILSICGLPFPGGISGKPFGHNAGPVVAEFYNYDIGAHRALYDRTYKFMQFERGRKPELYDLKTDPLETTNIASISPEITASMQDMLAAWVQSHPPRYQAVEQKKIEVSPSIKEDLKSLGYIQ